MVGDGRMETNIVVRPSWLKNGGGEGCEMWETEIMKIRKTLLQTEIVKN